MQRLQKPAVIRPMRLSATAKANGWKATSLPQTTLTVPPEGKLSDKLADNAVHDCEERIRVSPLLFPFITSVCHDIGVRQRTFRMAKAKPNIDLHFKTNKNG